jgi:xanthine dehydrogenase accessory factor/LAO/AO transport system kinase
VKAEIPGAGDRRAIARFLSRVERGDVAHAEVRRELAPHIGRAHVVGLTGAPGAGKSTLLHALLGELLARGQRIAVVAVDPSSPISGGAVLGDRVRMGTHGDHPDVFIRSVASRGHLGGLAESTEAMVDVLDAAGFDTVLIETVGAGQSEVEIMRVADTRVVACPPGMGDSVQSIKAGILEIADILVVTKSDLPGAESAARDLRDMLHLRAATKDEWKVPVVGTSATRDEGIVELVDRIEAHAAATSRGRRLSPADPASLDPAANRVRELIAKDAFVQSLGIRLQAAGEGTATVALTLAPVHINFNGTCHGGVTFALADTAFGLASNSHGVIAAGIDAHITYQNPCFAGDTLIAHAVEVSRSKRVAVYRVDVQRSDGTPVSSFTGTVYVTDRGHGAKL